MLKNIFQLIEIYKDTITLKQQVKITCQTSFWSDGCGYVGVSKFKSIKLKDLDLKSSTAPSVFIVSFYNNFLLTTHCTFVFVLKIYFVFFLMCQRVFIYLFYLLGANQKEHT